MELRLFAQQLETCADVSDALIQDAEGPKRLCPLKRPLGARVIAHHRLWSFPSNPFRHPTVEALVPPAQDSLRERPQRPQSARDDIDQLGCGIGPNVLGSQLRLESPTKLPFKLRSPPVRQQAEGAPQAIFGFKVEAGHVTLQQSCLLQRERGFIGILRARMGEDDASLRARIEASSSPIRARSIPMKPRSRCRRQDCCSVT